MDKKTIQIIVGCIVVFLTSALLSYSILDNEIIFIVTLIVTAVAFPVGIVLMFFEKAKQWGLALIIYSSLIFLVGASICSMGSSF